MVPFSTQTEEIEIIPEPVISPLAVLVSSSATSTATRMISENQDRQVPYQLSISPLGVVGPSHQTPKNPKSRNDPETSLDTLPSRNFAVAGC